MQMFTVMYRRLCQEETMLRVNQLSIRAGPWSARERGDAPPPPHTHTKRFGPGVALGSLLCPSLYPAKVTACCLTSVSHACCCCLHGLLSNMAEKETALCSQDRQTKTGIVARPLQAAGRAAPSSSLLLPASHHFSIFSRTLSIRPISTR
jgi:hypothetical protein